jgi:hypothetical protein
MKLSWDGMARRTLRQYKRPTQSHRSLLVYRGKDMDPRIRDSAVGISWPYKIRFGRLSQYQNPILNQLVVARRVYAGAGA